MVLKDLLLQHKTSILERWFHLVLETYPADTSRLLKRRKDRFSNPVGFAISREIEAIFEELLGGMNIDQLSSSLNHIVKIRSVQDFPPSQAIGFIFLLKKAIREVVKSGIREKPVLEEWLEFQSRLDRLALIAFDIYMKCREKICEIRVNEAKAEREVALRLLERMGFMKGKPEKGEGVDS